MIQPIDIYFPFSSGLELDSLIEAEAMVPASFSSGNKLARTPPGSREMTRKVISVTEDTNGLLLNGSASRGGSCTNIATGKV